MATAKTKKKPGRPRKGKVATGKELIAGIEQTKAEKQAIKEAKAIIREMMADDYSTPELRAALEILQGKNKNVNTWAQRVAAAGYVQANQAVKEYKYQKEHPEYREGAQILHVLPNKDYYALIDILDSYGLTSNGTSDALRTYLDEHGATESDLKNLDELAHEVAEYDAALNDAYMRGAIESDLINF